MFVYRDCKPSDLSNHHLPRTVETVCIVMILTGFSASFGSIIPSRQIPLEFTAALSALSGDRDLILTPINAHCACPTR
jgi:TRAP-type C4-dicarboxylate transport system permease large subunit